MGTVCERPPQRAVDAVADGRGSGRDGPVVAALVGSSRLSALAGVPSSDDDHPRPGGAWGEGAGHWRCGLQHNVAGHNFACPRPSLLDGRPTALGVVPPTDACICPGESLPRTAARVRAVASAASPPTRRSWSWPGGGCCCIYRNGPRHTGGGSARTRHDNAPQPPGGGGAAAATAAAVLCCRIRRRRRCWGDSLAHAFSSLVKTHRRHCTPVVAAAQRVHGRRWTRVHG